MWLPVRESLSQILRPLSRCLGQRGVRVIDFCQISPPNFNSRPQVPEIYQGKSAKLLTVLSKVWWGRHGCKPILCDSKVEISLLGRNHPAVILYFATRNWHKLSTTDTTIHLPRDSLHPLITTKQKPVPHDKGKQRILRKGKEKEGVRFDKKTTTRMTKKEHLQFCSPWVWMICQYSCPSLYFPLLLVDP